MTGRDRDPDDWFADSERVPSRGGRPDERPTVAASRVDADDWIGGSRSRRAQRRKLAESLPEGWAPIVAGGVLLVILVLAGLAVGGVFSSTPKPTVIPTATQIASTPTTTPATTPAAPTVPAPTTTLKPGDTGAQVRALQRALKSLGYTVGTVDGDYGTGTKTAVQQFQTASNLTADGIFGTATRAALVKALRGA
jgi:hypothetical protein